MLLDDSRIAAIVQTSHVLHIQLLLLLKSYVREYCCQISHCKQNRQWIVIILQLEGKLRLKDFCCLNNHCFLSPHCQLYSGKP